MEIIVRQKKYKRSVKKFVKTLAKTLKETSLKLWDWERDTN